MFTMNKRTSFAALFILALGASTLSVPAFAYDENSTAAVNVDAHGVALRGYDPVAYFTVKTPTAGQAQFSARHAGMIFHFASSANREMFKANPAKYAPQFGGFCAMGVALEKKLDGDPQAWLVADDGKLYLNVNKDVQKKYMENVKGNNETAVQNWPGLKNKTPKTANA
ncbi:YHS domain-containing (seleno)protein [Massilia sp. DJPM01]|uniref:YHS domain-containing (seleno)protein n=1 Tax=Massilia sp. DJPM01 TaxID=3024404 RepID=UPI00259D3FD5|nr:YHS domain-containing (seleno)protein [Massilia sp. DJPM01]MDM5179227.1 YHS domain-containing (seleno)protein [Massilia sp. DJPM01]